MRTTAKAKVFPDQPAQTLFKTTFHKVMRAMEVLSCPYDFTTHSSLKHLMGCTKVVPLIRKADADLYVSIDCMTETYLAQKVMPDRKYISRG